MKTRRGGSGLPISGGVLAVIVAGAFLLLRQEPFHPSRPRIAVPVEDQTVQARLWEDPFAAVARHRRQLDDGAVVQRREESEGLARAGADVVLNSFTDRKEDHALAEEIAKVEKCELCEMLFDSSENVRKLERLVRA